MSMTSIITLWATNVVHSELYGVATLRGGKSLPSIKRRILCGKSEVIIRFIRNMALALISLSSWKVAENTAKSDCLIFRAQLSNGSAIKGAFAPLFFFGHFAQNAAGILCPSLMDVSHLWTSILCAQVSFSGGRPARGRIQEREGRILIQYLHAKIQTNMPNALLLHRVSQNLPSK